MSKQNKKMPEIHDHKWVFVSRWTFKCDICGKWGDFEDGYVLESDNQQTGETIDGANRKRPQPTMDTPKSPPNHITTRNLEMGEHTMTEYELSYEWDCINPECGQNGCVVETYQDNEIIEMHKYCPYCGARIQITKKELSKVNIP